MKESIADVLQDEASYQFVCSRCWRHETLSADDRAPTCQCGFPLSVIAQLTGPQNGFSPAGSLRSR